MTICIRNPHFPLLYLKVCLKSRHIINCSIDHATTFNISLPALQFLHIPIRPDSLALQEACFSTASPDNERGWNLNSTKDLISRGPGM